jgi:D-alanyl-lipoteichoic acid acyltransferase DltB (MBOAT superfamily)
MKEFLEFVLSNFWVWLGFVLILGEILNFLLRLYNRTWRHANIRKHGYPPAHCDADGDLKPIKEKNDKE